MQMAAAVKRNPALSNLLDTTAWQHTSDSTISQVSVSQPSSGILIGTQHSTACLLFPATAYLQGASLSMQVMTDLHLSSAAAIAAGVTSAADTNSACGSSGLTSIVSGGSGELDSFAA